MSNKMSRHAPANAKVLEVDDMVNITGCIFEFGLMAEAVLAHRRVKMDQTAKDQLARSLGQEASMGVCRETGIAALILKLSFG